MTAAAAVRSTAGAAHVCVLGAGVVGLTSAVQLLERLPGLRVTLLAEHYGSDTTSDGAGGLWKPYALGSTPPALVTRWGAATLQHYLDLHASPEAAPAGVMLTSAFQLWAGEAATPVPEWASVVPHFRHLSPGEVARYGRPGVHTHGWAYTTVVTEGRLYLPWLLARFRGLGGAVEARRVEALAELAAYDAVINCAGLGAGALFGDGSVYPVRGQVLRVEAPWVKHYYNADGTAYIIPNSDTVVLGGTLQVGDWDTRPRDEDRAAILERCAAVLPSLRGARVVRDWVGLRPGRPSVRLELEHVALGGGGKASADSSAAGGAGPAADGTSLPVVHNYGHGGAGLTLAWGCASDAVDLIEQALAGGAGAGLASRET